MIAGDQGIDSVDEIKTLDDEMAENNCKVICRPGGTSVGGGADPGVKVSGRAEDVNLTVKVKLTKLESQQAQLQRYLLG